MRATPNVNILAQDPAGNLPYPHDCSTIINCKFEMESEDWRTNNQTNILHLNRRFFGRSNIIESWGRITPHLPQLRKESMSSEASQTNAHPQSGLPHVRWNTRRGTARPFHTLLRGCDLEWFASGVSISFVCVGQNDMQMWFALLNEVGDGGAVCYELDTMCWRTWLTWPCTE